MRNSVAYRGWETAKYAGYRMQAFLFLGRTLSIALALASNLSMLLAFIGLTGCSLRSVRFFGTSRFLFGKNNRNDES
jgi:hypothetical protein